MSPQPRVTYRDDTLPHQIRLFLVGYEIAVSCTCMRGIDGTASHYSPIEIRSRWEADEAQAVYAAHLAARKAS
jgi:hypothetical protein